MAPILPEYYKKSVSTLLEFGIKLINTVWRNTSDCTDEADIEISQIVYKLIVLRRYKLAARLASFALDITGKKRVQKDRHRKMLTVNLANAYALSKDKQKSEQALAREDWTSASDDFRLCVEAVKANAIAVSRIMKRIGRDGDIQKEDYAEWPVFEQVRDTDIFKETFRDIFGEDFKPYQAPEFDHERASEFINRKKLEKEASSAEEAGTVH